MWISELMTRLALTLAALAATSVVVAEPVAPIPASTALPTKLQYKSAISTYHPYTDQQVQSWREANDLVGRIGGWRAYAKEKLETEQAKPAPEALPHPERHGGPKQ